MSKFFSFRSNFFQPSEKDQKIISEIDALIKQYPSIKVVGRGTIVIEPSDITSSKSFQDDVLQAKQLVNG
jgi:hypothetical protein